MLRFLAGAPKAKTNNSKGVNTSKRARDMGGGRERQIERERERERESGRERKRESSCE